MNRTTVLGGAMLPHAPQFFTRPDTEPADTIKAVEDVGAEIGRNLKALKPDLWIMIANDHAQQFFHNCAPPFTLHTGGEASGTFAGKTFQHKIPSEISFEIVREMYRNGFDPAFTSTAEIDYALGIPLSHLGVGPDENVLPIYVNAYLPPQPTIERCYAFGNALANAVTKLGLRTVVCASGGMSHFPGTDRYSSPDLDFDNSVLARMKDGALKSLIGYTAGQLDDTGNIELRCWGMAAGALGDRKPDVMVMNPSWHHNYASLGWWTPPADEPTPHYPNIRPELVQVTAALHAIAHDPAAREAYHANPESFADRYKITAEQRTALVKMDFPAFVAMGAHPLTPFLANMHVERMRKAGR